MEAKRGIYFARVLRPPVSPRIISSRHCSHFARFLASWKLVVRRCRWLPLHPRKTPSRRSLGEDWRLARQGNRLFPGTAPPGHFSTTGRSLKAVHAVVWLLLVITASLIGRFVGRQLAVVISLPQSSWRSIVYLASVATVYERRRSIRFQRVAARAWELALGAFVCIYQLVLGPGCLRPCLAR